ncbi:MAG: hypothetical protein MI702_13515 [Chlorobiales bacterium]|nr:hypothetical protein [Chlorobiales bacterium]
MVRIIRMHVTCAVTVITMFFLQGCAKSDPPALNEADKRFAAFYADYMLLSGVAVGEADSVALTGIQEIDSLLDAHALTIQVFNERADAYRQEPKLWRAVLLEVKNNLQQNNE